LSERGDVTNGNPIPAAHALFIMLGADGVEVIRTTRFNLDFLYTYHGLLGMYGPVFAVCGCASHATMITIGNVVVSPQTAVRVPSLELEQ